MKIKVIHYYLIALSLFSCSSPNKEIKQENSAIESKAEHVVALPKIPKGEVIYSVNCGKDATQSYAAYLPSTYDSTKKYPVLFAFDAHAGGRIPVETYKELAEKYGYILVGSNNSKNGLDGSTLQSIAFTFLDDVKTRLFINEKRIYVTGFSGGARVAANVAQQGGVCGLASCSAGFQPNGAVPFNFIGFAGSEDFNSNEMIQLNKALDVTNTKHQLILYEGKHEWPSAALFENAFLWFEFNAMKDNLIPLNNELINDYKTKQESKIKTLQSKGKLYDAYVEADRAGNFIFGLTDCTTLLNTRTSLEKTAALKKIFTEKAGIEKREKELQDYYRKVIQEKDLNWWKGEIDNLNAQTQSKQNSAEEILLFKRTLSFLSLLSYMATNSMLNQNQLPQAAMYVQLYQKVDPTNSEVYYLQALLAAKQQNQQAVAPFLQKAIDAGFTDLERMDKEADFATARQFPEYDAVVQNIKAKK